VAGEKGLDVQEGKRGDRGEKGFEVEGRAATSQKE